MQKLTSIAIHWIPSLDCPRKILQAKSKRFGMLAMNLPDLQLFEDTKTTAQDPDE